MPDPIEGLEAVLSKLDDNALHALARTVTQGLKKSGSVKDAIQNIIKYSPDHLSILRRRAVTREILFNYLDDNNIKVHLPVTKNDLIDSVADFWNIPRLRSIEKENLGAETSSSELEVAKSSRKEGDVAVMAEQFSKWFYSMLNEKQCDAEHFFPDSRLKLNMFVNDDCETVQVENDSEGIKNTLLKTLLQHNLHFNLNETQEGIQGRVDPHGLVMVLACGTLHIGKICAGVFEQVFALARDPFSDNNWKIKSTELNVRSKSGVLECPKLCDSPLTSDLLMLPSEFDDDST